jgi:YVTN family beta-propeller protein
MQCDEKLDRMVVGGLLLTAAMPFVIGVTGARDASANTPPTTVTVGDYPRGVAVDRDALIACVTNDYSDFVSVIEGGVLIATIPVGLEPEGDAVDLARDVIYVTNPGGDFLSLLSGPTDKVEATLNVGSLAINPDSVRAGYRGEIAWGERR